MNWIGVIIGLLGGGFGVKVVDLLAFRNKDQAVFRAELLKEIGALREICNRQDKELKLYHDQIEELKVSVLNLRIAKHEFANLAMSYRARVLSIMDEMNEMHKSAGRSAIYDLLQEDKAMQEQERSAHLVALRDVSNETGPALMPDMPPAANGT